MYMLWIFRDLSYPSVNYTILYIWNAYFYNRNDFGFIRTLTQLDMDKEYIKISVWWLWGIVLICLAVLFAV